MNAMSTPLTPVTMNLDGLELRKTDDGWQYLSEGISNDPDHWCDATSVLGPFSGSGTGKLLDELLAAKEREAQRANSVCKNCRNWSDGVCDFIDTIQGMKMASTTGCTIKVTVQDDSGLWTELQTGPDFSCPSFSRNT
jgi:hypothetical protein